MPEPIIEIDEQAWQEALQAAGEMLRPGAKDSSPNLADKLHARTYTLNTARKRLDVSRYSMDQAVESGFAPDFC
jgi:hypothetical protein